MEEIKVADLVFKAHRIPRRTVRKCTPTSGALYLHKSLVGKTFDIILIPVDKESKVIDEVKEAEEKLNNLKKELN
jgi:hypothetical protein